MGYNIKFSVHRNPQKDADGYNDVTIESIGFTPDREFLSQLNRHGYHFINATGRGNVGHSANYSEAQIKAKLDDYFKTHDYSRWPEDRADGDLPAPLMWESSKDSD